ncbi:MAG: hypothetical protein M1820_004662 [Bogoriella megaspora]|nr:MAG: hypothetical protein M1820_004662 [Bogoriella megaspora]
MARFLTGKRETLVHSHAHEEIPGTVNLRVVEGDDTAYGQALFPVPADDPNDPLQYVFGVLGCSQAKTFGGLMAARIIHAAGSGVCEALPVQTVNDIYFLHERGKRITYYTAALSLGSIGGLPAGYMLAAGYSFRLFYWVEFAFGIALLVAAFFLVPETAYDRKTTVQSIKVNGLPSSRDGHEKQVDLSTSLVPSSAAAVDVEVEGHTLTVPPSRSYLQSLKPWSYYDRKTSFWLMILRSFTYYPVPVVLAFNYTFPLLIVGPPYNWPATNVGLLSIAPILGYCLALPFSTSSDLLAARLTRRNNGVREAEMRLGVLLPAALIGPAGLVVYAMTAQRHLHWVGYFAGVVMFDWSALFFFTITLAYAVDSYTANASEMLIAMNVGKNAISFGMGFELLTWIQEHGYARVVAGAFGGVILANNLFTIVFMIWGKRIRVFFADTFLSRLHKASVRSPGEFA